MANLSLNEASIQIQQQVNVSSKLELFYQLDECFGCPLERVKPSADQTYILKTKYSLQLELRQGNASACRFDGLELNSQAQYRIDVTQSGASSALECKWKTLDYGECLLCPFAILICFLFALLALEQVYTKFLVKRRSATGRSSRGNEVSTTATTTTTTSGQKLSDASEIGTHEEDGGEAVGQVVRSEADVMVARPRVECLDIFRGLTIAAMIFVNYGGASYAIWDHKPWDGLTLADFVFPFFIFSMGASIAISTKSLVKCNKKAFKPIACRIFSRSLLLFALGLCLNSKWLDYERADGVSKLRLTGVLQRFAISYLVVAFMYTIELTLSKWTRAQSLSNVPYVSKFLGVLFELLTAINYTAIYLYVTFYLHYSDTCPPGYVGPGGATANGQYAECTGGSAAWLDRFLLGENHLYQDHEVKAIFKTQVSHDPEGILGCTTSIVLTLIGLQCGKILASFRRTGKQKMLALIKWILLLTLSSSLVLVIPINKRLWSLTFVLVTALAAFLLILAIFLLVDLYACNKSLLLRLLSAAGKNSLFLYVGHSLLYSLLPWWFPIGAHEATHMLLLFRLAWATLVWLLIAHYMAVKKLFIRI